MNAIVLAKPWKSSSPPRKVLIIRLQALGDTIITLPYLQSLRKQYPQIELHFFTREEVSPIPASIKLFDQVITIDGGRNAKIQFIFALLRMPWLWFQRYDAVLDLQNNKISRIVRILLFAKAWTQFDKSSPISAGERTRQTIESLWHWSISLQTKFVMKREMHIEKLLLQNGWKPDRSLVVLNPAGFFLSRNWPLNDYVAFAKRWLECINPRTQFVLMLLPSLRSKADFITKALGDQCVNLMGKTTQPEAFAVLQKCDFMLTEDSGLMHMAWVQGIPTLALFSSSRKDWSAPQGKWSVCLDSSDLTCGPCGLEVCQFNDNRCLTRYSQDLLIDRARLLLASNK